MFQARVQPSPNLQGLHNAPIASQISVALVAFNYVRAQDSPFEVMIGTTKVIPNLTGTFHRNQPVGVYLQVYNAAIDQTTLRPAADAEYVLLRNGKEIAKHTEDWRQINDAGPRLTLSRLIDSRTLEPGEYQIQVRIRDHVYGETIAPSAKFTVVPPNIAE